MDSQRDVFSVTTHFDSQTDFTQQLAAVGTDNRTTCLLYTSKHVLIIGGGDGAMLREVSRHQSIETITMVEIDAGVVSFCRQYLPNHNAGSCLLYTSRCV